MRGMTSELLRTRTLACVAVCAIGLAPAALAQGTRADYERAAALRDRVQGKVTNTVSNVSWSSATRLWYVVDRGDGRRAFVEVDATTGERRDLFDAARLAGAMSAVLGREMDVERLPIERVGVTTEGVDVLVRDDARVMRVDRASGEVSEVPIEEARGFLLEGSELSRRGASSAIIIANRTEDEMELFWISGGERKSFGKVGAGRVRRQHTFGGHRWAVASADGTTKFEGVAVDLPAVVVIGRKPHPARGDGGPENREPPAAVGALEGREGEGRRGRRARDGGPQREDESPDEKRRVVIRDRNVVLIEGGEERSLTTQGKPEAGYAGPVMWSPDSARFVVRWTTPAQQRRVSFVESSPPDQVQPRLHTFDYLKPGDEIETSKPRLFDAELGSEIALSDDLFKTPWSNDRLAWAGDSSGFSFVYNQRGHEVMRLVGVTRDGRARSIVEEMPETFVDYVNSTYLHRIDATGEAIWMSERDGWRHLYLVDERGGGASLPGVKNQMTRGEWVVRGVDWVDEAKRQVWFRAAGIHADQDPYYIHFVRVNFDGTGLTVLTEANGTHDVEYSPDRQFLIDRYSRVDMPGVVELRRADGQRAGALVQELERADLSGLSALPWVAPQRFVAKGRDGKTDIHGVIVRPTGFDASKKYPVVEHIYAGPHSAFVPKAFSAHLGVMHDIAELGFIVVQIDGMGTAHRSKAFHNVCWKNLGDSGFPDRIAWIRAAAEKHGEMDTSRVGIFGGSAGGQSALRALLAHGDFYKVAVAACGCHDNRMDKIWWNEAWMGWPIDEHYAEQSNVTQAHRLTGKLLLIVGEMDRNVDPASTMQVVSALIKADKDFELLVMPGVGHGAAESPYGRRRRADFLVRNLLGVEPRRE